MAACPECGGRLMVPLSILALRRSGFRCRWCRATVVSRRWVQLARDAFVVGGAALAGVWFGAEYRETNELLPLVSLAGALMLIFVGAWLLESASPLKTVIPRGYHPWPDQGTPKS